MDLAWVSVTYKRSFKDDYSRKTTRRDPEPGRTGDRGFLKMAKKRGDRVDIVLRFVDQYEGVDTIEEHKKIIQKHGAAWLGKVGRGLSEKSVGKLDDQCKSTNTNLFLIKRVGSEYKIFRGKVDSVSLALKAGERGLIPKYYEENNLIPFVELWFKLGALEPADKRQYANAKTANGKSLFEALRGSASLFFLNQETN